MGECKWCGGNSIPHTSLTARPSLSVMYLISCLRTRCAEEKTQGHPRARFASGSTGGSSHQSLLGNLRKRRLPAFSVRGFPPKNPKGQSLGPETCHFLRRSPPKKTKNQRDRKQMATSGICRGTGGICLRSLFFFGFFGNPRRK